MPPLLINQIEKINLWPRSSDSKSMPHSEISNIDHQFFGSLKSKGRWLFMNNKSSVKIFWFQALWKPRFKNKRNFWINCVCTKAFHIMTDSQGDICIHCIPKRALAFIASLQGAFASWHTPKRTLASWHTTEETFASWHTHKGAFTSRHTYMSICIMTCPLESICTTRHLASSFL